MSHLAIAVATLVAFNIAHQACATPFQDLGFEQAIVTTSPSPELGTTASLPSWTCVINGTPWASLYYNLVPLDDTFIALIGNTPVPLVAAGNPIEGNFSAELSSSGGWPSGSGARVSIAQSGDIPSDAKTLLFMIRTVSVGDGVLPNPIVSIDDIALTTFLLSNTGDYWTTGETWLMAADIAPFAGSTHKLTFSAIGPARSFPTNEDVYDLDSISLSDLSLADLGVPEPASLLLLAPALLLFRRRRACRA